MTKDLAIGVIIGILPTALFDVYISDLEWWYLVSIIYLIRAYDRGLL